MSQHYFASLTTEELGTALQGTIFSNTLQIMKSGVMLLKAVADHPAAATNYEIVFLNSTAAKYHGENKSAGGKINSENSPELFGKLLSAATTTENSFIQHYTSGVVNDILCYNVTNLADGILVTHEAGGVSIVGSSTTDAGAENFPMKLQEEAQLIHSLTQTTPDILFVMNLYSKDVVYINRAVEKLLGFTEAEIEKMPSPFFDVMHADDRGKVLAHLEEMKNAALNETREITYRIIDAKSNIRWFRDRNTVFKVDANGKAIEKTGVLSEISQHKESEAKIENLNRILTAKNKELEALNAEMKTFNNIAANEYKETLQNLYTNLEFIITKDARNLSDGGKGNLRKMQGAIQKMKLMTDDIVSFSKIHTLDDVLAAVDVNRIIALVQEDLAEKINECEVEINVEEMPHISGFPLLLSLLFYHLIDNAIKFQNPEAGPVINILYAQDSRPGSNNDHMSYHRMTVSDDGIGFNPEESESLFTMFYRAEKKNKYKGSGIGLAICKKIMDLHNGFILAESNGQGASFSCFFPV